MKEKDIVLKVSDSLYIYKVFPFDAHLFQFGYQAVK